MTYDPLDGVLTRFIYDCRNRLVQAGDTVYEYNAENTRIALTTPEYREEYLVNTNTRDGLSQVLTATRTYTGVASTSQNRKNPVEVTTYTHGSGLVSQYTETKGTEYYHYDNLGSTRYLTLYGPSFAEWFIAIQNRQER